MGKHNFQADAYQYACVKAFTDRLTADNISCNILSSKRFIRSKVAFECADNKEDLYIAAMTATDIIFSLEPSICDGLKNYSVGFNERKHGSAAVDMRDIILYTDEEPHEVGIHCPAGRQIIYHTGLSRDIGEKWIGYPSGDEYIAYMDEFINRMMAYHGQLWDITFKNKTNDVYAPSVKALKNEIERMCRVYNDAPRRLFEHFFGNNDYYKIVMIEKARQTKVMAYNMFGTLGKDIPIVKPPEKLIECRFKEKNTGEISKNMLSLIFDGGWIIDMRIHNASNKITSTQLRIDIQLSGTPYGILQEQRRWNTQVPFS